MTHIVQFKVESTGVTHRLSIGVASPQCCYAGVTVGTQCTCTLTDNLNTEKKLSGFWQLFVEYFTKQILCPCKGVSVWVIPVFSWVGLEVCLGRLSCDTVHRRYTGSGLYHPDATEG